METTLAQVTWLLELDLREDFRYPQGFWPSLPKGSTVYLISKQWLRVFKEKVFAALDQCSVLDCAACPLTNVDLRDETGNSKWKLDQGLSLSVVVPESVYLKLFHTFVFDPEDEIKGWVMWGSSFELRFITPRIDITYFIQIDDQIYCHGTLSFYENVTISELWECLYGKEKYLMSQLTKQVKLWNMKWNWAPDQIIQELGAKKGKVSSIADSIDKSQFGLKMLKVFQTLTIILRDKKKYSIFRAIPRFFHRGEMRKDQSAVGLKNLGNTCFLNSILQTFAHIPDLAMYYFKLNTSGSDKPMTVSLADLVKEIYGNQTSVVLPLQLRAALTDSNETYRTSEQQDAEELMLRLLSELIQEEGRVTHGPELLSRIQKSPSLVAWISHISSQYSLILALFTGLMRMTVTCTKCGKADMTYSPFLSLPLNLCPSKLYTIRVIDYEPAMPQTTFRLESQTPFEQQESIMSIWNAITETAHIRNFLIGEVQNRLFSGPLGLSNVPNSQVLMVLKLPDSCALDTMVVIFDVFTLEGNDQMSVGTKILCCDLGMGIERLKLKVVEHLRTAGNSYFDTLDFFPQITLGRVSEKDFRDMMVNCTIVMQAPNLDTMKVEYMSLEQIQIMYKVNKVSQLKDVSPSGEVRVLCTFPSLPKLVQTMLTSFREEIDKSIENYSEKMLTVTLHQLIEYNLRPKPTNEEDLTHCSNCGFLTQHIIAQGVERFPKVLVFPLQRVRMSCGKVFKSGMEVCFPSTDLDLSVFESGPMYSNPRYDLTAVIRHSGKGVSRGHYTTYAKHPLNAKWYCCNDSKCESVAESEVLQVSEAYMLVYIRN